MRFALIAAAAAMLLPTLSIARTYPVVDATVHIPVSVPTPAGLPHATADAGMVQLAPTYEAVPGLIRKYLTTGQADFRGLYLFRDRASAQARSSDAWRARVVATYGAQPTITYFDAPLVVDNSGAR